jgi:ABC-2 type transport system permease protein
MKVLVGLAYRFEVFAVVVTQLIVMVASVCLWNSAYGNEKVMEGLAKNQMVTYAVLAVVLHSLFQFGVQSSISRGVRYGTIAVQFLRPVDIIAMYLCDDLGDMATAFFLKTVPLLVLGAAVFGISPPASTPALLLSLLSVVFAFIILWLLSALTGMITFWAMSLGQLGVVKDVLVNILSGMLIPVWFFPPFLRAVLRFLPFQYTYQTPIGIYIGKIPVSQGLFEIAVQLIWAAVLYILVRLVWHRARKHMLIQGG